MNITVFLLSVYIVLECIYVAQHLDKGGRVCQFIKYGSSAACGALALYYTVTTGISWQFALSIAAISTSMWPSTFYRFSTRYNRRA